MSNPDGITVGLILQWLVEGKVTADTELSYVNAEGNALRMNQRRQVGIAHYCYYTNPDHHRPKNSLEFHIGEHGTGHSILLLTDDRNTRNR